MAAEILRRFHEYSCRVSHERLQVILGVDHLRITGRDLQVEWVGRRATRDGEFFRQGPAAGESEVFDRIIVATGFGLESYPAQFRTPSYWRNDTLAQPRLDGSVQTYVVSGYGDGALVDLCRLTIERFRQDRILYELFGHNPEPIEEMLGPAAAKALAGENVFDLLRAMEDSVLKGARDELRKRIRKDTRVFLHIRGGGKPGNTSLPDVFGDTSSFANRLLLFLLYRCGAFIPRFDELQSIVDDHSLPSANVICRYGPSAMAHLATVFTDEAAFADRFREMKELRSQSVYLQSAPGVFPDYAKDDDRSE
ncbi:hypothetical protein PYV61_00160 [Roseisolibacter sp. H3M3-2]|nr:hypothetical protein [Roseisolibacter sp. H3M3-2]